MTGSFRRFLRIVAVGFAFLAASRVGAADNVTALVVDRVYLSPQREPLSNATVIVVNDRIAAIGASHDIKIPAQAHVIHAGGMSLMSGFWNCHVHFIEPQFNNSRKLPAQVLTSQLQAMLTRYGFVHVYETADFDLSNTLALRERIQSGEVLGPTILTTGMPLVPPKGTPGYIRGIKFPEFTDAQSARDFVRKQQAAGADGVKIFPVSATTRGNVRMPVDVARAAVEAGHAMKQPVFAHPTNLAGVRIALQSGVDVLAHVSPDDLSQWDDELIGQLRERDVALIPTLKLYHWDPQRQGMSSRGVQRVVNSAIEQLRRYSRAGGAILFGTDVGYMTDYDPREEFELMNRAGLSFAQILASLTTTPAARFGAAQSGTIAAGMYADLVLVQGDPRENVRAFGDVLYVLLRGKVLYNPKRL